MKTKNNDKEHPILEVVLLSGDLKIKLPDNGPFVQFYLYDTFLFELENVDFNEFVDGLNFVSTYTRSTF